MKFQIDKREIEPIASELGAALLDSQRLEYSISYLLLLTSDKYSNDEVMDEFMMSLSKKTLGGLITKLGQDVETNEQFMSNLTPALDARNYIVHKFLNDRNEQLLTIEGRKESLKILKAKRKVIVGCFDYLNTFVDAFMKLRGLDLEKMNTDLSKSFEREYKDER